jgi:putative phosphoesterase
LARRGDAWRARDKAVAPNPLPWDKHDNMANHRLVEKTARVPAHRDGSLRLAVVADTHSAPHPATSKHLRLLAPDAILHAGDIGDLGVLDELATIAPVFAVRGNIDVRAPSVPDVLTIDVVDNDDGARLRILLTHIAVNGPRLRPDASRLARLRRASLVVCGHSHVPFIGQQGEVSVFNPGSAGPRRFQLPTVFGTIDITTSAVQLAHFDCASGQRWVPRR